MTSPTALANVLASPFSLDAAAARLAVLLTGQGGSDSLTEPGNGMVELLSEAEMRPRPLERLGDPPEVWAVDGGQGLVRDARCFALWITRAANVCYSDSRCTVESTNDLRYHLLGGDHSRSEVSHALARLGVDPPRDVGLDGAIHLLRDAGEWEQVQGCLETAPRGSFILIDGDLQPDWRIPSAFLSGILDRAQSAGVTLAGVTKHSSLSLNGAPLVGRLELAAEAMFGQRAMWWAPVGTLRRDVASPSPGDASQTTSLASESHASEGGALQVCVARLDPDAPYAFRVDIPASADPEIALGKLSASCNDAAFPGYPYPLTVADRLAACPRWLCAEAGFALDDLLDDARVSQEVRSRAFADRHHLMERS